MPRRRSSPSRGFSSGRRAPPPPPSRVPAKIPSAAPAHPPPAASAVGAAQPRQPGLFGQMASTAVGVGIGSAVGHTVGAAITGRMGGGDEQAPVQDYTQQQQPYYQSSDQSQQGIGAAPCQLELKQFIDCAQNQYDITLCQGFNEALRQCRISNGLSLQ